MGKIFFINSSVDIDNTIFLIEAVPIKIDAWSIERYPSLKHKM